jgi:hypothetical protein
VTANGHGPELAPLAGECVRLRQLLADARAGGQFGLFVDLVADAQRFLNDLRLTGDWERRRAALLSRMGSVLG